MSTPRMSVATRSKLVPSYLTGAIGGILGFLICYNFVTRVVGNEFTEQGLVFGWVGLVLGWLIGIGAFKYPISWLLSRPDPDHQEELRLAGAGSGVSRYFRFTTDHKVVGIQYLALTMIMLALGGLGAMLIRTELIQPGAKAFPPNIYNTIVTMHGMLMIATIISLFVGPFGNFIVPIMIGARDMAFPRLNALSFALLLPAVVIFLFIPFVGGVQTGWTVYAPLSVQTEPGMDAFAVALIVAGMSSMLGAVNIITTVITMRAPGMRWSRLPIFVWGILGSVIIAAAGTSSFTADLFLILLDRLYRTTFFIPTGGGNPWLSENLFWFFGHPEVYLLALPAWGALMELLPVFSRKPLFSYRTGAIGLMWVTANSFILWQHHMFTSGWATNLRGWYMLTTETISLPTGLVFLSALGTIWRGRLWLTLPMAFALTFFWNFLIGGITGIYLSDVPADIQLHGGMFVVAHFHYTILGSSLFLFFAVMFYWFPKMTGRMLDEKLGWIQFWSTFIGFNVMFLALFYAGLQGMPRRVADYDPRFAVANLIASLGAYVLGASVVLFFFNVVWSWRRGVVAVANPWNAKTLEWQVPTPVPLENFEEIPVVTHGFYNYGEAGHEPPAAPGVESPAPVAG